MTRTQATDTELIQSKLYAQFLEGMRNGCGGSLALYKDGSAAKSSAASSLARVRLQVVHQSRRHGRPYAQRYPTESIVTNHESRECRHHCNGSWLGVSSQIGRALSYGCAAIRPWEQRWMGERAKPARERESWVIARMALN